MLVNFCFCFWVSRLLGRLSWNVVENRKRTVSCRKINLGDSKRVICSAKFVGYHFRDGLQTEMGLHYRSTSAVETGVYIWASTHCGRQQALRYTETAVVVLRPCLSAKQQELGCFGATLPTPARLTHHHSPFGRGCCDIVDYESSCHVAQPQLSPRRG